MTGHGEWAEAQCGPPAALRPPARAPAVHPRFEVHFLPRHATR
eukprot:CAMPEP_0171955544 /NCGR_PEP_ID=MMETSP0993-20121228/113545_1 /TAXON_ID=483369 /ORGANISM="non described non described, Strain CCMP2098" /LENGTH=42 /DNA_ID= /DNA_START= /DNA_END= /DNA_ORIENTATION=